MEAERDERVRQVAIGVSILLLLMLLVAGLLMTWRKVPGLVGETLGTIMGILTTPFFMEASFIILGAVVVIYMNHLRQTKDGDDFVTLEIPDAPETKSSDDLG